VLYALAQWIGGIALHWFYRDIRVVHGERIPEYGPLLIAMNHQNALVDAMLAWWVAPRDIRLTAKASLAEAPGGGLLMNALGIIPLRRAADERGPADPMRNRAAFTRIATELALGRAILIFPEGRSHNEPVVAPLKSGLARIALHARGEGVRDLCILPIGITFQNKAVPNTDVVVEVGEPIVMDEWPGHSAQELTDAVAERLRAVSLTGAIAIGEAVTVVRHGWLVRVAAWWGRVTHEIPIRIARRLALAKSADEGEPAMYTMTFGLGLTLLSYAIEIPLVWWILGPWVAIAFAVSLPIGAYWAAYADHPARPPRRAPRSATPQAGADAAAAGATDRR
jgi:1-acyl-sn-glycerol-3-phosphate acyltransferase